MNNGREYLLMHSKLPYTVDFEILGEKASRDDADVLDDMAWDVARDSMWDFAANPSVKLDLIWMGIVGVLLGLFIGTTFL